MTTPERDDQSHRDDDLLNAAAVLGISAVDVVTAVRLTRASRRTGGRGAVRVRASTTVHKSPEEAYAFWRSVERLPTFMAHLQTVEPTSDKQSHWVARGPAGRTVEWDAEIVADEPGRQIAWQSLPETEIENSGTVRFTPAPAGQGTEVSVELEYRPPAGRVGAAVATLFGEEPLQQVNDDLRRFKQVLEAGAIVRSDASPDGVHTAKQLKQRPAQPVAA